MNPDGRCGRCSSYYRRWLDLGCPMEGLGDPRWYTHHQRGCSPNGAPSASWKTWPNRTR